MAAHDLTVFSLPLQFSRGVARAFAKAPTRQFVRVVPTAKPIQRRSISSDPARMCQVRGTVTVKPGTPVARLVYLYSEHDHMLAGKTMSDPITGAFEFPDVWGFFTYTAMAVDHTGQYRAEAHDGMVPEPML